MSDERKEFDQNLKEFYQNLMDIDPNEEKDNIEKYGPDYRYGWGHIGVVTSIVWRLGAVVLVILSGFQKNIKYYASNKELNDQALNMGFKVYLFIIAYIVIYQFV